MNTEKSLKSPWHSANEERPTRLPIVHIWYHGTRVYAVTTHEDTPLAEELGDINFLPDDKWAYVDDLLKAQIFPDCDAKSPFTGGTATIHTREDVDLAKFTEKIDSFKERYKNNPERVSIKGAMAFMARLFYQYPAVAREWYENLPKATMD